MPINKREVIASEIVHLAFNFHETADRFADYDLSTILNYDHDSVVIKSFTSTILTDRIAPTESWSTTDGSGVLISADQKTIVKASSGDRGGGPTETAFPGDTFHITDFFITENAGKRLFLGVCDSTYVYDIISDPVADLASGVYFNSFNGSIRVINNGVDTTITTSSSYGAGDTIRIICGVDRSILFLLNGVLVDDTPVFMDTGKTYTFSASDGASQTSNYTVDILPSTFVEGLEPWRNVVLYVESDSIDDGKFLTLPSSVDVPNYLFHMSLDDGQEYIQNVNEEYALTDDFRTKREFNMQFQQAIGLESPLGITLGSLISKGILSVTLEFKKYANTI